MQFRLVTLITLATALPALAAPDLTCGLRQSCSGPADKIACIDLKLDGVLRLEIPDSGDGRVHSMAGDTADLAIDLRTPETIDMSYRNTAEGFRVVLQLAPATGDLVMAQLREGKYELVRLACTEAR